MIRLDCAAQRDRPFGRQSGLRITDQGRHARFPIDGRQHRGGLRKLLEGAAGKSLRIVHGLDRVPAAGINRKYGLLSFLREAQRRAQRRDTGDTGEDVRHLRDGAVRER